MSSLSPNESSACVFLQNLRTLPAAHELGTPISRVGRWVESDDLQVGDKLLARDGSQLAVTAIRTRTTQEWVYNLTVRRTHTYTVGSADDDRPRPMEEETRGR